MGSLGGTGVMARPAGVFVVVASMCFFIGAAVISGVQPVLLLGACLLVSVLAVSVFHPEVGIFVVVVLVSSIVFEETMMQLPVPGGSIYVSDLFLLALLAVVVLKLAANRDTRLASSSLNAPMAVFLVVMALSAYNALIVRHVGFSIVVHDSKKVMYYALFFIVVNMVRDKERLKILFNGLMLIACLVAAAMAVQSALGDAVHIIPGRVETLETTGHNYMGVTRVLPPGQTLVYVMFVVSACMAVLRRGWLTSLRGILCISLLSVGMVLTFNRNYWTAAFLSMCIFAGMISKNQRARLALIFIAAVIVSTAALTTFSVAGGKPGRFARAVEDRMGFLFQSKRVMNSSSIEFRRMENMYAFEEISRHPVFGIGLANRYRPAMSGEIDVRDRFPSPPRYIHNGYLWLLIISGMFGLGSFLWLCFTFIRRGLRYWDSIDDAVLKPAVAGFAVSGIGIMAAAIVNPLFMQRYSIAVIGLMMGISESAINLHKRESGALDER